VAPLLTAYALPAQAIHAVYPSPRFVPARARVFVDFLAQAFAAPALGFAAPSPQGVRK
jgi:DNA-binding transcriptional LysR family regulator